MSKECMVHNGKQYLRWEYAGGPNECDHEYAAGIPCPRCDDEIEPPADIQLTDAGCKE